MRALLLLAGMVLLVHAPPAAAARLDTLAKELRERPLAIDSELAWFFDAAEEARLLRTLRASPVDVHAAFVPHLQDDESGGDGSRIAVSLHQRLRRPGLYLVVDQHGYFSARAYAVPREVTVAYGLEFPARGGPMPDEIIARVQRLVAAVAAAPRGRTTDDLPLRRLAPYGERTRSSDDETTGDAALGAGIVFGMLGLLAGGAARLRTRRAEAAEAAVARRSGRRGRRRRR